MAQKLKFGNGTFATKEGSTLAYNDEGGNFKPLPFTTTRNSIATRVNKEGLIEVVGNDIPRIDYTDSADGVLLLENSSTNLVTYSEDISQSSWLKITGGTGVSPSITSNYAISPDGTQNASRVVLDAPSVSGSNISMIRTNISGLPSPHDSSISFYIKSNTLDNYKILVYNGSLSPIEVIANNSWQRIELSTTVSSSADRIHLGLFDFGGILTDSYADVSIWGAQLEQQSFVTSLINTSGSTVTRAADTASGAGNSEVFNDSEGVLFANIKTFFNDLLSRPISVSDGTTSNRINLFYPSNQTQVYGRITSGGTRTADMIFSGIIQTLYNKIAVKYKVNDFALWVNGFEVVTDSSGAVPTGLKELNLDNSGGTKFLGKTKEIGYYDTSLTDEELEYLTSYRSLNELVTELNLNEL
jgi:hypothetical protein